MLFLSALHSLVDLSLRRKEQKHVEECESLPIEKVLSTKYTLSSTMHCYTLQKNRLYVVRINEIWLRGQMAPSMLPVITIPFKTMFFCGLMEEQKSTI